jgi:hypothetical protein
MVQANETAVRAGAALSIEKTADAIGFSLTKSQDQPITAAR